VHDDPGLTVRKVGEAGEHVSLIGRAAASALPLLRYSGQMLRGPQDGPPAACAQARRFRLPTSSDDDARPAGSVVHHIAAAGLCAGCVRSGAVNESMRNSSDTESHTALRELSGFLLWILTGRVVGVRRPYDPKELRATARSPWVGVEDR
jgi:hypothetical protein